MKRLEDAVEDPFALPFPYEENGGNITYKQAPMKAFTDARLFPNGESEEFAHIPRNYPWLNDFTARYESLLANEMGYDADRSFSVALAVKEAVMNAFYLDGDVHALSFILTDGETDSLEVIIENQNNDPKASSWDPRLLAARDPYAKEALLSPNGRGFTLLMHIADGVTYAVDGRVTYLTFDLGTSSKPLKTSAREDVA